jgi:hypothetical protein
MVRVFYLFFLSAWLIAASALWLTQVDDVASAIQLAYLTTLPTVTLVFLAIMSWRREAL